MVIGNIISDECPNHRRHRESILQQLGSITLMRRGTLSEQSFERKTPDGRTVRFGPYFKFQIWQDGRNQTRRVGADEARILREDIDNFHLFEKLCEQLAQLNIQQTIDLRTPTSAPETAEKNLQTQCLAEKYRETELFLAQARQKLTQKEEHGNLTQWLETGLRDAFARDACGIVEDLLNDRQLIPDDTPPLDGEIVHNNRPISVHTLFGSITIKHRYFHHTNSHSGRAPLDLILDITEHHTPAVAKLICQASANAGDFYQEAQHILNVFTGLQLEARSFHRLINRLTLNLTRILVCPRVASRNQTKRRPRHP